MWNELNFFANTFVALFVIIDPFAVLPVYLTLTERFSVQERRTIRRKATLTALAILFIFALSGVGMFKVFSITMPAFQIAGGILLMILGISQLNQKRQRLTPDEHSEAANDDISVFPLGTPLLAGPGAISTVVLYTTHAETMIRVGNLMLAITAVLTSTYMFLKFSPWIFKILGKTGLNVITRIMGIILTAIGVQFMITGIKEAFSV